VRKGKFGMGFGIGMICGALLLQVLLFAQNMSADSGVVPGGGLADAESGENGQWSEEQLFAAAESLEYQLHPKGEKLFTERELEEAVREAAEESGPSLTWWILVPNGSTSEEVAELLAQSGLVADKPEWLALLTERGLHSRIRAGVYTFDHIPEPEELLVMLTNPD